MTNKEFLEKLGNLIVQFQSLEKVIEFIIWIQITDDQNIGKIITSEHSFRNKCNILINIGRETYKESKLLSDLEELVTEAITIEEDRNKYIHSGWILNETEERKETITRYKIASKRKGLIQNMEEVNIAKLDELIKKISILSTKLHSFITRINRNGYVKDKISVQ
jgi:hypothetical protein